LAETIVFRGGEVLAAEVSTAVPRVANLAADEVPEGSVYALVTVRLHQGRTISAEDYSLRALGGLYRCIAVRTENEAFNAANWHISTTSPEKKYGMLFALQIPAGQKYNNARFDLVCNAPGKWNRTAIPFTDRRGQGFSPASSIPNTGRFSARK
jgi:hypothetical protein